MFFKQKKIQKKVTGKWGIPRSAECSETRGHRFSVKKNRNCSEENYLTTQGPRVYTLYAHNIPTFVL
jgi:hypothetical protein